MTKQNSFTLPMQEEMRVREILKSMSKYELINATINTHSTINDLNKNAMARYLEGQTKEEISEKIISDLNKNFNIYSIFYFDFYLPNKNKPELSDDLNELLENVLNEFNLLESNKDKEVITNLITREEFMGEVREILLQECTDMDDNEFEKVFEDIFLHVICSALYDEYLPLDGFELQEMRSK